MFVSTESIRTGQDQVDNDARLHHQRLSTRDSLHYGKVWFEEVGDLFVAHGYRDRQAQLADMIKLMSATGTGLRLLADLKALSTQGVRIAIGPRDDVAPGATHIPLGSVSTTADGEVLWDCNYLGFLQHAAHPTPDIYKRLIGDLTDVRNLAAKQAWPAVPPLSGKDIESSFQAELVLRGAPALAQSEIAGMGATPRYEFGAGHMPSWRNESPRFDSLNNLMPAWLTSEGRQIREELIAMLKLIDATSIGKALLNDLWVYGRSRGVMVVHRSSRGKEGVHKLADAPIWGFDKSGLAARAQSTALTDREARASGGFLCLLEAHRELADKLGTLARLSDLPLLQRQFEAQLLDERKRHLPTGGATVRRGAPDAGAWIGARAGQDNPGHISNSRGTRVSGFPSSSDAALAASTEDMSLRTEIPLPSETAARVRQESPIRSWLQNSLRIFSGSRADLPGRMPHTASIRAVPNPYTPGPTRGTGAGL